MKQLGRSTLRENPISFIKRKYGKLPKLLEQDKESSSNNDSVPRVSESVNVSVNGALEAFNGQKLLMPQKIETVNEYLKKKPGRPRKIRQVLEIYPLAGRVEVNDFVKRRRGRPRKNAEIRKNGFDKTADSSVANQLGVMKRNDPQYFAEEIFVTRLRNKRL